ncbi:uncharacterized protein LOC144124097 [Amblyomma americanum]
MWSEDVHTKRHHVEGMVNATHEGRLATFGQSSSAQASVGERPEMADHPHLLAAVGQQPPCESRHAASETDFTDFTEKVRDVVVEDDDIIVSFDITSLFTSVPVDLAVDVCAAALQNDDKLSERTPLEAQDLSRLLKFCLENTYFVFRGSFYKQLHGTAMGASIPVTAANLTMEAIENRALASFHPRPNGFLRYIDDCFCIVKKDALAAFTRHINSMEKAIQFTVEEEVGNQLPFLDVLVERVGHNLSFRVFRKSTHTSRYLHFNSVSPACHKRAVAASLIERSRKICSRHQDHASDLVQVRRELTTCGYPRKFLASVERRSVLLENTARNHCQSRAAIPYVPGVSEALGRVLRSYDVHVAHVLTHKLRHELVNVKEKLEKEKFPGEVYRIPLNLP